MCDQTEITYEDGEVVWVKLGACWWPGQVVGYEKLPEDIQIEFKKKPLIAVVQFFREDKYEYVKNLQQIYKYNCTQKDEFIKKGLDKYRAKSKDGSSYMDKFPDDVIMAEKLTGGDMKILKNRKFTPEEKPDISSLFGEKKLPKKRRDKDDNNYHDQHHHNRRSYIGNNDERNKLTSPSSSYYRSSDHEVRIRHQTNSQSITPNNSPSPIYSCPLCTFTSTRVNVIICHNKSHKSTGWQCLSGRTFLPKTHHNRMSLNSITESPKRKYVRKNKSFSHRSPGNSSGGGGGSGASPDKTNESLKRKHLKPIEKMTKKKKTDPELREKLLADWDDGSDEDMMDQEQVNLTKSMDSSIIDSPSRSLDMSKQDIDSKNDDKDETDNILAASDKLLEETDKISCQIDDSLAKDKTFDKNSQIKMSTDDDKNEQIVSGGVVKSKLLSLKKYKKINNSDDERRRNSGSNDNNKDNNDDKSKFSCFDFDEEEPEPALPPPVRKIARVFGEKNTSLKKEIIKEFTMSQALAHEKDEEEAAAAAAKLSKKNDKVDKNIIDDINTNICPNSTINDDADNKLTEDIDKTVSEASDLVAKIASEAQEANLIKSKADESVTTELEIVEILEVEKEKDDCSPDESKNDHKIGTLDLPEITDNSDANLESVKIAENPLDNNGGQQMYDSTVTVDKNEEPADSLINKPEGTLEKKVIVTRIPEIDSERVTIEEEDDNMPISQMTSGSTGTDGTLRTMAWSQLSEIIGSTAGGDGSSDGTIKSTGDDIAQPMKRRRGRPRKVPLPLDVSSGNNGDSLIMKTEESMPGTPDSQQDTDRKTSESDTERSFTGRRRKPNKKYLESDIYSTGSGRRTPKTDDSQSETDERITQELKKGKRGRKAVYKKNRTKSLRPSIEFEFEFSDQTLDSAEESSATFTTAQQQQPQSQSQPQQQRTKSPVKKIESKRSPVHVTDLLASSDVEIRGSVKADINKSTAVEEVVVDVKQLDVEKMETNKVQTIENETKKKSEIKIEMLPPKKSQIKKFEASQIDLNDGNNRANDHLVQDKVQSKDTTVELTCNREVDYVKISEIVENIIVGPDNSTEIGVDEVQENIEAILAEQIGTSCENNKVIQDDHDNKQELTEGIDDKSSEIKTIKDESMTVNDRTDEEALLKMLEDTDDKPKIDDTDKSINDHLQEQQQQQPLEIQEEQPVQPNDNDDNASVITETIEIDLKDKCADEQIVLSTCASLSTTSTTPTTPATPTTTQALLETLESGNDSDVKNMDETSQLSCVSTSTSSPSPSSSSVEVSVPVKKREKPRIIENVQLKEPMHILKSKLLEKQPIKIAKHKLDDITKQKNIFTGLSKPKIMKISNITKTQSPNVIINTPQLQMTQKLQIIKPDDGGNEKIVTAIGIEEGEKVIQQSGQSLEDIELDINSIPFVLSEDLNPETIEHMPIVISSIIPVSQSVSTASPLASSTSLSSSSSSSSSSSTNAAVINQMMESTPVVVTKEPETITLDSSPKKKSPSPAILKNKVKAKPTITSIRTINPPLTGGVKGLKFQNQTGKSPIITQRATSSKYVIVQTSGSQPLRYTVQGKTQAGQKLAIAPGKSAGNAQIVQHGSKVVILQSPQSGQPKVVPYLPKNKVQKIVGKAMTGFTSSPKAGSGLSSKGVGDQSPTTSKIITPVTKLITTKGVLSPVTSGSGVVKSTIYTPISTTGSKMVISSKALVTNKGTILSPISGGGQGGTKTILTQIPANLAGKTLITSSGLMTSKGTILTPITGQQVKAIAAAKNPGKLVTLNTSSSTSPGVTKVSYQAVQQKVQLPMMQKIQKASLSSGSPVKVVKSSTQTIVLQQNTLQQSLSGKSPIGKKIMRHVVATTAAGSSSNKLGGIQQQQQYHTATTTGTQPFQSQQRSKSLGTTTSIHKLQARSGQRAGKTQNIVVHKISDAVSSSSPLKSGELLPKTTDYQQIPTLTPGITTQKFTKSTTTVKNAGQKVLMIPDDAKDAEIQLSSSTPSPSLTAVAATPAPEADAQQIGDKTIELSSDQQQVTVTTEVSTTSESAVEESPNVEDTSKPSTRIMALPTESSDGTQTYVLVTVDDNGHILPLDNNALLSLEGTTQNPDGTRTLYIDPSSLGAETAGLENLVLQFDNSSLSNLQTQTSDQQSAPSSIPSDTFSSSDIIPTSNQDILAAALANTDFQQEIGLPEVTPATSVVTSGLTSTSLINQTILQSTIIPTSEPISSAAVLETSLTLNQPIMTPLEVPSNLSMVTTEASPPVIPTITSTPTTSHLELPLTITNPSISYITTESGGITIPGNSMPDIGDIMATSASVEMVPSGALPVSTQYLVIPNIEETQNQDSSASVPAPSATYSVSIPDNVNLDAAAQQITPSMPIIDDNYVEENTDQVFIQVPMSEMLVTKSNEQEKLTESLNDDTIIEQEVPDNDKIDKSVVRDMPMVEIDEVAADNGSMVVDEQQHIPMTSANITSAEDICTPSDTISEVQSSMFDESKQLTEQIEESKEHESHQITEESSDNITEDLNNIASVISPHVDVVPMEIDQPPIATDQSSSVDESAESLLQSELATDTLTKASQEEAPSQSYNQPFDGLPIAAGDSAELPSQSASKADGAGEPSQSIEFQLEEMDQNESNEPTPTQSFDDTQANEATQSENTNAPTQSSDEHQQQQQQQLCVQDDAIDDPNFPTQSYDVGNVDNVLECMETDGELSQEGNIPSQSNDVAADGIGTSFMSNSTGLNEDETASSSYVPETPETQERDQDQESAISTSSYEIPTCEDINIASSSIPDTSIRAEHTSIHNNGVPEIPTSSYSLNPDSSSTHVDAVPTSSYDDQVIIEQNVSTSYQVPISMPGLEDNTAQNFVSDSQSDQHDEPTSYYARHSEDVTSEASQSYFGPEGPSPSYTTQTVSPSYYEPPPESEASPSYYSSQTDGDRSTITIITTTTTTTTSTSTPSLPTSTPSTTDHQSQHINNSNINITEASQSFYQDTTDELRLRQSSHQGGGEATPTYTERYPVDYTIDNSPVERHDLVESSQPAIRPTDR